MILDRLDAWSPWSPADAVRWLVLGLVGHAACVGAWWLAARESSFEDQVRWIALAIVGFSLVAFADVTWLLRARFLVIQRREGLLPAEPVLVGAGTAPAGGEPGSPPAATVVAGPGLDRYHRSSCQLAVRKGWPAIDRAEAESAGLSPCGVCRP